jgi:RNA polymerase sigma-70 factor (ECF subfamily)
MPEVTDAALWQRAAAGDRAAFGTLFERHASTVYNYASDAPATGRRPRS